jgi:hypothetical protein
LDLALDGGRIQGFVFPPQPGLRLPGDGAGVGQDALERGRGQVVCLADPRAGPGFRKEFLLRREVVRQQPLERPDPVQQLQLTSDVS